MSNADTLSGIPLKVSPTPVPISGKMIQLANLLEATPVDRKIIKSWTQRDPMMSQVLICIQSRWSGTAVREAIFFT